jgi:peptidoglycan/xylan/chitin deacetylase (PgdA/CDA1 family)
VTVTPTWRSRVKGWVPRRIAISRLRPSADRSILLTFDDGPTGVTPQVLERLDRWHAKAVFFVIGRRVRRAPETLASVQRAGHVIGNHSLLHRRGYVSAEGPQVPFGYYYQDCARCQDVVAATTGRRPDLFRPPGGRISAATLLTPIALGMHCVLWSREVADWRFTSDAEAVAGADALAAGAQPRDIILLHDSHPFILPLLDRLLPALADRGFDLQRGVEQVL